MAVARYGPGPSRLSLFGSVSESFRGPVVSSQTRIDGEGHSAGSPKDRLFFGS